MRKTLLRLLLPVGLLILLPLNAWAASALPYQFVDIQNHWAKADLAEMIQLDVLSGYAEGGKYYAKPNKPITRVEFAAMMAKALRLEATGSTPNFADWQQVPQWARGSVAAMQANGIINGVPGGNGKIYFQPNKNITRAEIAAIVVNAMEQQPAPPYNAKFTDVPTNKWYSQSVLQAEKAGLIAGRTATTFVPAGNATRAEVLVILNRFMKCESNNAPKDDVLTGLVKDYLADLEDVIAGKAKARTLSGYTTGGAALSLTKGGLGVLENASFNGQVSMVSIINGPNVEQKSNRVAAVKIETMYKLKYGNDGVSVRVTERYRLAKIGDKWKIYSVEVLDQKIYP